MAAPAWRFKGNELTYLHQVIENGFRAGADGSFNQRLERFWAENYKMFQVDRVDNSPINEKEWKTLTGLYSDLCKDSNVSVFSDFRHGI